MTTDIELPPLPVLPRPDVYDPGRFGVAWGDVKLVDFAQAYARAAIEADRRLRAVPGNMVPTDAQILDWVDRRVCNVVRLASTVLRIDFNNGADCVFVGTGGHKDWREAIRAAMQFAAPTAADGADGELPGMWENADLQGGQTDL